MQHVQNVLAVKKKKNLSPSTMREYRPSLCGNVSKTSFHSNHFGYAILTFCWVDIPACAVCLLYIWACDTGQDETIAASQYAPVHRLARYINHWAAWTCNKHNCNLRVEVFSHSGHLVKVNSSDWTVKHHETKKLRQNEELHSKSFDSQNSAENRMTSYVLVKSSKF